MARRTLSALIALMLALATIMPVGVRAMPVLMPAGLHAACSDCGDAGAGAKLGPGCSALVCAGAVATLPAPTLPPTPPVLRGAYAVSRTPSLIPLTASPDPFPPRPGTPG